MSSHARPSRPAMIAMYVLALIRGYNWVVMKRALHYMGPLQFGAMRTLLAALILFAVVIALKKPLRLPHMAQVGLIGLLQTCGFTALIIWALVAGGAGKVAVLSYTMPFWVMLLAWPLLGERIRGTQWIAVMASVTGLLCILEPWHLHGGLLSDVLALMSGLCWAAAVVGAMLYIVVACYALAWLLWLFALQRLPAGTASINTQQTPGVAVITAWLE